MTEAGPFLDVIGFPKEGERVPPTGRAEAILIAQGWIPPGPVRDYCTPGCISCDDRRRDDLVAETGDWTKGLQSFMIVCPECGNKRCPKATHHDNACTGSNEANQPGSAYQQSPQWKPAAL